MGIQLRANPGPTGRLLEKMLREKGLLEGAVEGVVNYGYGGPNTLPTLNRKAGTFNKLQELEMLREKEVATVPFSRNPRDLVAPLLGRSLHHTRGNDILLYRSGALLGNRNLPRHDFFTQLVPKRREFRVWAFRRKVIGTYEKVLSYPQKLGRRGRIRDVWNYRNGFGFSFVHPDQVNQGLKELAAGAIDALKLDFGAVDILQGEDNKFYVLEVNTAPGVEGPRQCISSLVNHIGRWVQGGFKRRNGEDAQ